MNPDPSAINRPFAKVCAAWGCAGGARVAEAATAAQADSWVWLHSVPWSTLASFAAFVYTLALTCEWAWKKLLRPFAERRGWLNRRSRKVTESEWAALMPRDK